MKTTLYIHVQSGGKERFFPVRPRRIIQRILGGLCLLAMVGIYVLATLGLHEQSFESLAVGILFGVAWVIMAMTEISVTHTVD